MHFPDPLKAAHVRGADTACMRPRGKQKIEEKKIKKQIMSFRENSNKVLRSATRTRGSPEKTSGGGLSMHFFPTRQWLCMHACMHAHVRVRVGRWAGGRETKTHTKKKKCSRHT